MALLAFCAVLLLGGIGVPLYRNEGLRALLAAEALADGAWIVPRLYGEPHLAKPPGMGVAIALCSWPAGGVTPLTARLPSVLAGLALVGMAWAVFEQRFGAGLAAAALMPCSLLWLDRVPSAEIDLVQAAWVAGSLLCLLHAAEQPARWGWWLGAMACMAGGLLTKWTAPAFFYLAALAWLGPRRRLGVLLSRGHLAALGLFVLVATGWVAAVAGSVGWRPLADALGREALLRLSPAHHPRPYPWGELATFPAGFLLGCLPAALLLPLALKRPDDERQRGLVGLCWAWLGANLLFWAVVPGHRPRHLLPAQPAVALLAAWGWLAWRSPWRTWALALLLACWLGVKLAHVGLAMPRRPHASESARRLRLLVPAGRTLWLAGIKDEGLLFAYGRPARRARGHAARGELVPGARARHRPGGGPAARLAGRRPRPGGRGTAAGPGRILKVKPIHTFGGSAMRALVLLLAAPFAFAADAEPPAKADGTAQVTGTATVPAEAESFKDRVLEIRLYKHDPRLADKRAALVEKVEIKGFSHAKGKATSKAFALGKKEKLEPAMGYYLTLFVLDGTKRTHMGKCDHVKDPFNKVLTKGNPSKVKATLSEIKR